MLLVFTWAHSEGYGTNRQCWRYEPEPFAYTETFC